MTQTTHVEPDAPPVLATTGAAPDDYEVDGEFDLDRYYAETRREAYPFRWAGQLWELPNVYDLPTSVLDLVGKDDLGAEEIQGTLRAAFGAEQWNAVNAARPLPISATMALFYRWLKWSGVDPGEALSFAVSSAGTAKPSKRTSRGSTTGSTSARRSTGGRKSGSRRVSSSA
jgi:hypothetical protein